MRKTLIQTLLAAFCAILAAQPLEGGGVMLIGMRNALLSGKHTPTAKDYVQDGLVAMWDGIENAGWGTHTADKYAMRELASNAPVSITEDIPTISYVDVIDNAVDFKRTDYTTKNSRALCSFEIPGLSDAIKNASRLTVETVCTPDTSFQTAYASQRWGLSFQIGADQSGNSSVRRWWQGGEMAAGFNGLLYYINQPGLSNDTLITMRWWQPKRHHVLVANYKSSPDAALVYVDGELLSATFHDFWSGTNIVGDYLHFGTRAVTDVIILPSRVYAIRLYSRALTAGELAANYAVDKARFNLP